MLEALGGADSNLGANGVICFKYKWDESEQTVRVLDGEGKLALQKLREEAPKLLQAGKFRRRRLVVHTFVSAGTLGDQPVTTMPIMLARQTAECIWQCLSRCFEFGVWNPESLKVHGGVKHLWFIFCSDEAKENARMLGHVLGAPRARETLR